MGGGGGVGLILKKKFQQALVGKKKIARGTNEIEKKFLHYCKQEKKNVAKLFHHSWGALQNPDNLQASEPLWLAY